MKKLVYLCLATMFILFFTCSSAFAFDYSVLDSMSLDDLLDLQKVLSNKITAVKAAESNDGNDTGMWTLKYYVDEFKNPTSEGYITGLKDIVGTYSNSATTDSELKVRFLIDKEDVAIKLFEHGSNEVKNYYSSKSEYYSITMLDPSGIKIKMNGWICSGGDRLYFSASDAIIVLRALSQNASVSFSIVDEKYHSNRYLFTIKDTSFFDNAYRLLTGMTVSERYPSNE